MDINSLVTIVSQITTDDIVNSGVIASSIVAILALGKHLWVLLMRLLAVLWRLVYSLILVPLGYILTWTIEGIIAVIDAIRQRLTKSLPSDG